VHLCFLLEAGPNPGGIRLRGTAQGANLWRNPFAILLKTLQNAGISTLVQRPSRGVDISWRSRGHFLDKCRSTAAAGNAAEELSAMPVRRR